MIVVELGNAHPQEVVYDAATKEQVRRDLSGARVSYCNVNTGMRGPDVGIDRLDGEDEAAYQARHLAFVAGHPHSREQLAPFPYDGHDDSLFPDHIASPLAAVSDPAAKVAIRRLALRGHMTERPDGVTHLPAHGAFVAVTHPVTGAWSQVSAEGTVPTFVYAYGDDGAEVFGRFLAEYWDVPYGRPAAFEDLYWTQYPAGVFPPGAIPPPEAGIVAMKTSWGDDSQALKEFWWPQLAQLGLNGTATATSSTSLTGGTETSTPTHTLNDSAGMMLVILAGAGGDGGKYAFIASNTTGTAPVYTVDRWYIVGSPGGAAATTPSATSTYTIVPGGMPELFVALTTNATAPSRGGTAGTQDAASATQALTSEVSNAGGGLNRKIYTTLTHTAAAATVVSTTTFTTNANDPASTSVQKAAMCVSVVAAGSGLCYLTALPTPPTLANTGDQLTITWTFTMTNT